MKVLKNPVVAVLLCAVIVIASTLGNVNRLFGAKCRAVTDGFYNGVEVDGYTQKAMSKHLENIIGYVDGLMTIAKRYDVDCDAVSQCSDRLKTVLHMDQGSVATMYAYYAALMNEEAELEYALSLQELSERDQEGYALYVKNIESARSAMESSGYNESVREFMRKYDRFPTGLLAALAGVDYPEYFA